MRRSRRIDPLTQEVFKFFSTNPPERGETILVDGKRHRVTRCRVTWADQPEGNRYRWTLRCLRARPIA